MKSSIAAVVSVIGVVAAGAGAYYAYQQVQVSRTAEARLKPDVVVCVDEFSYTQGSRRYGGAEKPAYLAHATGSVRLINRGGGAATVTRIVFNPVGTTRNGKSGGMGDWNFQTSSPVPANGMARISNFSFTTNEVFRADYWIDKPEEVNARVFWAGGSSDYVTCRKRYGEVRCTLKGKRIDSC